MTPLGALFSTTARTVATRARLAGFAVLGLVGVLVAWRVGASNVALPDRTAVRFTDAFSLNVLAPIVALVFGTSALGDPLGDGTLVYLWARPRRRADLAVGAFGAASCHTLPLVVIPALVAVATITSDGDVISAVLTSTIAATLAYTALFLLLGLISDRALVWGIGYVLILETFVARGGRSLGFLSVHAHAASILESMSGVRLRLGYFAASTSTTWIVVVTLAAVAATIWRLRAMEVA